MKTNLLSASTKTRKDMFSSNNISKIDEYL